MASTRAPGPRGVMEHSADGTRAVPETFTIAPGARAAAGTPTAGTDALTEEQLALLLDLGQILLDIVGIVEPTPFADTANAAISAARSDWTGAGLSLIGVIPYAGDAAKAGKLSKHLATLKRALAEARRSARFAELSRPLLVRLQRLLSSPAVALFPDSVQTMIRDLRQTLDRQLGPLLSFTRLSDEAAEALLGPWMSAIDRMALPPPGRNNGILWSKIGKERAMAIADALTAWSPRAGRGAPSDVVTLEMTLDRVKEQSGFDLVATYERWIKPFEERFPKEAWDKLGSRIWAAISQKYASVLEGDVRVFVDGEKLLASGLASARGTPPPASLTGKGAVLYDEMMAITDLMESNAKISSVVIVDSTRGVPLQRLDRDTVLRLSRISQ